MSCWQDKTRISQEGSSVLIARLPSNYSVLITHHSAAVLTSTRQPNLPTWGMRSCCEINISLKTKYLKCEAVMESGVRHGQVHRAHQAGGKSCGWTGAVVRSWSRCNEIISYLSSPLATAPMFINHWIVLAAVWSVALPHFLPLTLRCPSLISKLSH